MARKPRRRAVPAKGFTEATDLNQVEQVATSAAAANKAIGPGHNGTGITDDELQRQTQACWDAHAEVTVAMRAVDKARGVYRNTLKVAKDKGAPKDEILDYIKIRTIREKRGTGAVVTQHRNIGRIMRVMGDPLFEQYELFSVAKEEFNDSGSPIKNGMDPELQGNHAYRNNEPLSNNPFNAGTVEHVDWTNGWKEGERATATRMGKGGTANGEAPATVN